MAQNVAPILVLAGNNTANNSTTMTVMLDTATGEYTGTSANNKLIHTAGSNGSYIKKLIFTGVNGLTSFQNVAAAGARIYLNNGSTNTTATNNQIIGQVALFSQTTGTTPSPTKSAVVEYPMDMMIPPNFCIFVGLGITQGPSYGWVVTAITGNY